MEGKTRQGRDKNRGIGIGVAAMFNGAQCIPLGHAATMKLNPDGTFTLFCGAIEFGQGSDTAMSQIAAEEAGCGFRRHNFGFCGFRVVPH